MGFEQWTIRRRSRASALARSAALIAFGAIISIISIIAPREAAAHTLRLPALYLDLTPASGGIALEPALGRGSISVGDGLDASYDLSRQLRLALDLDGRIAGIDDQNTGAGEPATPLRASDESWNAGLELRYRDEIRAADRPIEGRLWMRQTRDRDIARGDEKAWGFLFASPHDTIDWNIGAQEFGEAYRGSAERCGVREYFGNCRARWRPGAMLRRIDTAVVGRLVEDLVGEADSNTLELRIVELETASGDVAGVRWVREEHVLTGERTIAEGMRVPAGEYRFGRYDAWFASAPGRPVGFELRYGGGTFYDGLRDEYAARVDWRPTAPIGLGLDFRSAETRFGDKDLVERSLGGRLHMAITQELSCSASSRYDAASGAISLNGAAQWGLAPGNEVAIELAQTIARAREPIDLGSGSVYARLSWRGTF